MEGVGKITILMQTTGRTRSECIEALRANHNDLIQAAAALLEEPDLPFWSNSWATEADRAREAEQKERKKRAARRRETAAKGTKEAEREARRRETAAKGTKEPAGAVADSWGPQVVTPRSKFYNAGGATRNRDRESLEEMKKKQHAQLKTFRALAKFGEWEEIHRDHFDWYMFPIDDGRKREYNVFAGDVKELIADPEWPARYHESVKLVAAAWGWDLDEQRWLKEGNVDKLREEWEKQPTWDVRLAKIIRSLWLFGQNNDMTSMQTFAREVKPNGKLKYGSNNLDEVYSMEVDPSSAEHRAANPDIPGGVEERRKTERFLAKAWASKWDDVRKMLDDEPASSRTRLVNAAASSGRWTALHYAARSGNKERVSMLLQLGADPHNISQDGHKPSDVAKTDAVRNLLHAVEAPAEPEPEPSAADVGEDDLRAACETEGIEVTDEMTPKEMRAALEALYTQQAADRARGPRFRADEPARSAGRDETRRSQDEIAAELPEDAIWTVDDSTKGDKTSWYTYDADDARAAKMEQALARKEESVNFTSGDVEYMALLKDPDDMYLVNTVSGEPRTLRRKGPPPATGSASAEPRLRGGPEPGSEPELRSESGDNMAARLAKLNAELVENQATRAYLLSHGLDTTDIDRTIGNLAAQILVGNKPPVSGNLEKLGGAGRRTWQKRYFVLGDEGIKWYKIGGKTTDPEGMRRYGDIATVKPTKDPIGDRQFAFAITPTANVLSGKNKVYTLAADNEQSRDKWIIGLKERVKILKTGQSNRVQAALAEMATLAERGREREPAPAEGGGKVARESKTQLANYSSDQNIFLHKRRKSLRRKGKRKSLRRKGKRKSLRRKSLRRKPLRKSKKKKTRKNTRRRRRRTQRK